MKTDITMALIAEHQLILRMVAILERNALLAQQGLHADYGFFLDAVTFIRNYADRFHHAKEEEVLFDALVANGMPRENSPVAAMLLEHEEGRGYVGEMERNAREALSGAPGLHEAIAANALAYVELLRGHIAKEDDILYPLAERLIPEEKRIGIIAGYAAADAAVPDEFVGWYESLVLKYEQEGESLPLLASNA